MTEADVMTLLAEHQNARGIEHWQRRKAKNGNLQSFGIGLTQLRKLAKQIGRDHQLAKRLWKSKVYDAKVIALLIEDPKQLTREQAERQVEQMGIGMLAHVFASCGGPLAATPYVVELMRDWMANADPMRRQCGFSLLYELSKKKLKALDDAFFLERIEHIRQEIRGEEMWVREAMNTALLGIGKRNRVLNRAAIAAAKEIGPVDIDYGSDNSCEPLDVLKHLTSDYVKQKFAK